MCMCLSIIRQNHIFLHIQRTLFFKYSSDKLWFLDDKNGRNVRKKTLTISNTAMDA